MCDIASAGQAGVLAALLDAGAAIDLLDSKKQYVPREHTFWLLMVSLLELLSRVLHRWDTRKQFVCCSSEAQIRCLAIRYGN